MNNIQIILEKMSIKNFENQKKTQKNKIKKLTKLFLNTISGNNIQLLLKSIENDTKKENDIKKENYLIKNLSKYYNILKKKEKKNFLEYSKLKFGQLKKFGYKISKQFYYSSYQPNTEKRDNKKKIILEKMEDFHEKNTRITHMEGVRIRKETYDELFIKFIDENQNDIKLGRSTFIKYLNQTHRTKLSKKYTDYCKTCFKYEENKISEEIFNQHINMKSFQYSKKKDDINNIKEDEIVIIFDFKMNIKLSGPKQVSEEFYKPIEKTCLGIIIYYKNGKEIKMKYIDLLSDNLNHDAIFIINSIEYLKENIDIFYEKKNIKFWFDCGTHFRNLQIINYLFLLHKEENYKIELNFFIEGHGKNECDTHFSVLNKYLEYIYLKERIENIDTLIERLNKKKENNNYDFNFIKIDIKDINEKFNMKFIIPNLLDFYYILFNSNIHIKIKVLKNDKEFIIKEAKTKEIKKNEISKKEIKKRKEFNLENSKRFIDKFTRQKKRINKNNNNINDNNNNINNNNNNNKNNLYSNNDNKNKDKDNFNNNNNNNNLNNPKNLNDPEVCLQFEISEEKDKELEKELEENTKKKNNLLNMIFKIKNNENNENNNKNNNNELNNSTNIDLNNNDKNNFQNNNNKNEINLLKKDSKLYFNYNITLIDIVKYLEDFCNKNELIDLNDLFNIRIYENYFNNLFRDIIDEIFNYEENKFIEYQNINFYELNNRYKFINIDI